MAHYWRERIKKTSHFFAAQEMMNGKNEMLERVYVCMETEGNDTKINTVIPKASYFICMQQYRLPNLQHCPLRGLYGRWFYREGQEGGVGMARALLGV